MTSPVIMDEIYPLKKLLPPGRLLEFLGEKTGLIRKIIQNRTEPGEPQLFHYSAIAANASILNGMPSVDIRAAGSGDTCREAFGSAIGEVIERSALSYYDKEQIRYLSFEEMLLSSEDAAGPELLSFFSDDQFKQKNFHFSPFRPADRIGWTEGVNLLTGKSCWLPAQAIHLSYRPFDDEPTITYPTTSGCACATTVEEALVKSIYEQLERDALMLTWLLRIDTPIVDLSEVADSQFLKKLSATQAMGNHNYVLRNITLNEGIPVFMAAARIKIGGKERILLGASSHSNPKQAARKALLEVAQSIPFLKLILAKDPYPDKNYGYFLNFEKNLRFYAASENQNHLQFLFEGKAAKCGFESPTKSFSSLKEELASTLQFLKRHQLTPIAFYHGSREYADLGLHVVRVYIPELMQLYLPGIPFLGSGRIDKACSDMGLKRDTVKLNLLPHPLP